MIIGEQHEVANQEKACSSTPDGQSSRYKPLHLGEMTDPAKHT